MKLIGYNATMGAGKSTAVELLRQEYPSKTVELVKMAGTLYRIQEYIYEQIAPVYIRPKDFVKDRKLLQWIGTEFGRSLDVNLWVNLFAAQVVASKADIVVCDDVRFDNEAEAIRNLGGKVIRIVSDKASARINTTNGIANHASESGIRTDLIDAQVPNNGTIEEFRQNLNTVYQILGVFG